jgi:energy-coupling factor transporter ATP-binding protein EcfA2
MLSEENYSSATASLKTILQLLYRAVEIFTNKLNSELNKLNKLYFAENDRYSFEITCSPESIYFSLYRGYKDISLDYQSTGFRWFFNLYFNLLCKNELQSGDIIIMDQPGMDLHIKGREELRRFLKEFARRNDLTIVIATHEPSMIDLDCLDEIRVVSMKDNQSSICNDFTAIDPDDPDCLKPIKEALTVENRILFDPDMNLVFVEGITDYNYLLAFKKLLGFKNLSFLPIKGVGNVKDSDIEETQKTISRELIRLKKHDPILLVDSDKAGQSMKKINGQDSCLRVCTLADIDPAFKSIESLFDPEDLKKLGLVDEKGKYVKHASDSAVIKNHIESYEFSETTKENFKKVLQHLDD